MKKETKIIIGIVSAVVIVALIIVGVINYYYYYNADARAATNARRHVLEMEETYKEVKRESDKVKQDIEEYQRAVNRIKNAK